MRFRDGLSGPAANQLWGGLGIVVVDDACTRGPGEPASDPRFFDTAALLREARARRAGARATRHGGCAGG